MSKDKKNTKNRYLQNKRIFVLILSKNYVNKKGTNNFMFNY